MIEVLAMKTKISLPGKVHGIKGIFLAESTTALYTDTEFSGDTVFSCWSIEVSLDVIREKRKNIGCIDVDDKSPRIWKLR